MRSHGGGPATLAGAPHSSRSKSSQASSLQLAMEPPNSSRRRPTSAEAWHLPAHSGPGGSASRRHSCGSVGARVTLGVGALWVHGAGSYLSDQPTSWLAAGLEHPQLRRPHGACKQPSQQETKGQPAPTMVARSRQCTSPRSRPLRSRSRPLPPPTTHRRPPYTTEEWPQREEGGVPCVCGRLRGGEGAGWALLLGLWGNGAGGRCAWRQHARQHQANSQAADSGGLGLGCPCTGCDGQQPTQHSPLTSKSRW